MLSDVFINLENLNTPLILVIMLLQDNKIGPTWDPPGADRTQVGPMLALQTLLSG